MIIRRAGRDDGRARNAVRDAPPLPPRHPPGLVEAASRRPAESWREIADVIAASDPLCNGVLLLGLDAARSSLRSPLRSRPGMRLCRGFAIGRSIFGAPARDWFAGSIDDATAIARIAACYERMIESWRRHAGRGRA